MTQISFPRLNTPFGVYNDTDVQVYLDSSPLGDALETLLLTRSVIKVAENECSTTFETRRIKVK